MLSYSYVSIWLKAPVEKNAWCMVLGEDHKNSPLPVQLLYILLYTTAVEIAVSCWLGDAGKTQIPVNLGIYK